MYFIVPDICNQNGCFILVTLQWFEYSTNPNGSTLYTEKSRTFKNDWNPFLSFVFHNDWLQNHRWFSFQEMASNFEAVFIVFLQTCSQIYRGKPYSCIFTQEFVPLLGAMTDKLVLTFFLWSELGHKQWPGKGCSKNWERYIFCLWTLGRECRYIWCSTVS